MAYNKAKYDKDIAISLDCSSSDTHFITIAKLLELDPDDSLNLLIHARNENGLSSFIALFKEKPSLLAFVSDVDSSNVVSMIPLAQLSKTHTDYPSDLAYYIQTSDIRDFYKQVLLLEKKIGIAYSPLASRQTEVLTFATCAMLEPRGAEILQFLLQHGLSTLIFDKNDRSLLHYAAYFISGDKMFSDILDLLSAIEYSRVDVQGYTALHLAVKMQNVNAVKHLLRK